MRTDEPAPEVQQVLQTVESMDVLPLSQYGPEGAREVVAELRVPGAGPDVPTEDRTIPGPDGEIPVRIYHQSDVDGSESGTGDDDRSPVVVYYHGGGFVLGDLEGHDPFLRYLTEASDAVFVSVDYRLAPEHPFPAAVEDAYAALEWVAANPDAVGGDGRVAVMGDSAGGTLAAVAALMARDRDGPDVDQQLLIYPATDPGEDWPSRQELGDGYYLTETDMEWFDDLYFGSEIHHANPYALPNNACDLSRLPPATVVTAGFDPLRDEGVAYADRLDLAGVPVTRRNYESMIHGFATMIAPPAELDRAHDLVADLAADLFSEP